MDPPDSAQDIARARLAAIVDSSDDAIVGKTLEGIVTSWNLGAERLFGYSPDEIIGRSITTIIPRDRLDEETLVLTKVRAGERVDHFETVRQRKDGSLVDISLTVSPIRDPSGRIVGASKIARDISDRKRTERQRAALLAEAQRANRAKDELLAMLGHELRNPVGAILNAVQLVERPGLTREPRERAFGVIARQSRQLADIIDDLLDLGRVLAGKFELASGPADLAELVRTHLEAAQLSGSARQHTIDADLQQVHARVDAGRFEQIVANLIDNAAKYSPRGSAIRVSLRREGHWAVLIVEDEGAGISRELLPHVFDLFVQGTRDYARSQGGLGLGLTLVRRLVELHGGTIEAASEGLGRGSRFTVRLPALPAAYVAGEEISEPVPPARGRRRILVVEDNEDAREMLRALLETYGHTVWSEDDGLSGLETALRLRPEVAIVDIGLPELDGYELARRIRAAGGEHMLLIALTGYGSEDDVARAMAAGFDVHLKKPLDYDQLDRVLAAD